jgi:hypothetical protein
MDRIGHSLDVGVATAAPGSERQNEQRNPSEYEILAQEAIAAPEVPK